MSPVEGADDGCFLEILEEITEAKARKVFHGSVQSFGSATVGDPMSQIVAPHEIVDRQLRAYNDRDLDAYCLLFAPDVTLSRLDSGEEFVRGMDALRAFYALRFSASGLHCQILSRIELGRYVVDHELIDGINETQLEVIAIYEVCHSLIKTVRFMWP